MSMSAYGATPGPDVEKIHHNWGWFLLLGVVLGVLGFVALGFTVATTLISTIILSVLVLIGGVAVIGSAFFAGSLGGGLLRGVLGVLLLLAGLYLMFHPAIGALTLTMVMAWYFIIAGIVKIVAALVEHYSGWGWTLFAGIVSLLLGVLLLLSWPVSGLYAIGLFIGIDLILSGISWVVVALAARSYPPQAALPAA